MGESSSDRRLAENEVIFRQANEAVQQGMRDLRKTAKAEGFDDLYNKEDKRKETRLHFFCECADEKCRQRIVLPPSKYKQLHSSITRFVIKPGHQIPTIERVVLEEKQYLVVDKIITPPPTAKTLHPTKLDKHNK